MRLLRKILRDSIPELADALERCWTIALDEWLAAIAPQKDSFNAYPHLRNHEKHLERIWLAYEKHHGPSAAPLLSPIEIYVMLSSILFHDIGRTRTGNDHGEASQVIIMNHRAELGIPSDALAEVIGRISRFHDLPARRMPDELGKLSTTSIDPWGEIRQSTCAALLTLIDYMDGTVTRVTPAYIRNNDEVGPVGAFRRVIRNVEIDFEGQMVKVVLGDFFDRGTPEGEETENQGSPQTPKDPPPHWNLKANFKRYSTEDLVRRDAVTARKNGAEQRPHPRLIAALDGSKVSVPVQQKAGSHDFEPGPGPLPELLPLLDLGLDGEKHIFRHVADRKMDRYEMWVARQYVLCNPPEVVAAPVKAPLTDLQRERIEGLVGPECLKDWLKETKDVVWGQPNGKSWPIDPLYDLGKEVSQVIGKELKDRGEKMAEAACEPAPMPKELLLAVVLGNCRENAEVLRKIRQTLWTGGVPVRAWLVEWREHLYNEFGQETREPILTQDDLRRTVDAMVSLATRSIRSTGIPYDTLAAEVREIDVRKTRRAVQRIGVVWRGENPNAASPAVLVGQSEWRLLSGKADAGERNMTEGGAWLSQARKVKEAFNKLSDSDAGESR